MLAFMSFATGCGNKETATPTTQPAAQPAEQTTPAPEVNEEEIIAEAVQNFLINQEKTAMVKADAVKDRCLCVWSKCELYSGSVINCWI